jgi:hypothetical protein
MISRTGPAGLGERQRGAIRSFRVCEARGASRVIAGRNLEGFGGDEETVRRSCISTAYRRSFDEPRCVVFQNEAGADIARSGDFFYFCY